MYPIIDELLKGGESRNVEFKAFWYWNNTTPNLELQKKYGEFLKDIIALFNTVAESGMKYLLIGVEENKMKQGIPIKHPAFLDENKEYINDLLNLKEFETKFHKKLEIFTEPLQLENTDIKINISSYIKIELVGDLLLFAIQQAPCLLALKKDLQCQRGTFKTNAVIGRKLKGKNDPEIYQLPVNEVYSLQRELLQRKKAGYFDKDISIEKIAEAYLHTRLPQANKKPKITATSTINGICYEIHEIEDSCVQTRIKFLYFSKHTSQQKTWDTLKDNALVGNENKLFILLDRFNKNGGLINKEHIAKLVKKDIDSVEIYYLDDFIQEQLCGEKLEASIFHKHSFYIKNFIPPTLEEINDKGADLVFSEWLRETENPILVIKGTGGIGKTTVVKKFVDKILEDKTTDAKYKHVLFVSSHDIISDILARTENVKNVFDFYDILASKYNKEAISKDIFEILVGNGNLLVVLDGLDEVIANLGNRFNTELFLSSIIENCYNTFYKTKIIITCRDYFWDMQQLKKKTNIELVSLKAFDKEQVVKYIQATFA
ncbi:NACHT domain-containing protein [Helicobacter cinaedi]|uniref:NACHT domain-containing protein n=1 Tax=Helicobacter cinaedi TaxID=213 RepID=UPI000DA1954E|nr:NACHT domain-containing protein [Helicobacter cinaedi]